MTQEFDKLNPLINKEEPDVLYHLGLSNKSHDLPKMFGDVKFVCMGGSAKRMEGFANLLVERGLISLPAGASLTPIGKTERYSLFKVGPVISVNHGMGMPSMSILLHELYKLLFHAGAKDFAFIRIGTSGGIGIPAGSVVVAQSSCDSVTFESSFQSKRAGKIVEIPCVFDEKIVEGVLEAAKIYPWINCCTGLTMSTDDFYEEQGRLDGALCGIEAEERMEWLERASKKGVKNIEMESLLFGAFCHRSGVPAASVNTTLLDRLNGDQVTSTPEELSHFSLNSQEVAIAFMFKSLGLEIKNQPTNPAE